MEWYAVYTKSRHENIVAFRLYKAGIEILNPKVKLKKNNVNTTSEVIEPLFPCYLFAHFNKNRYLHLVKYTRGVKYIVGKSNPISVQDKIIQTIKDTLDENNVIVVKSAKFKKGDRIFIREGPFKNFYGIFERELKGSERVMILLDTMCHRIELDTFLLEKV